MQVSTEDKSLDSAIVYLDNRSVWKKVEMEKYSILKGLFGDMNNFELNAITNDWRNKLATSSNFEKVVDAACKTLKNNWNPKQDSHTPTYNKSNDETINVNNYCNWLNIDQSKQNNAISRKPKGSTGGKPKGSTGGKPGVVS